METIKAQEKDLFEQIIAATSKKDFVCDGVVDETIWNEMPIKILFLLKEAVGDSQTDNHFSLTSFLRYGCYQKRGVDRTWRNLERWTQAILSTSRYGDKIQNLLGEKPNWMRCIAAVNVKKHTGAAYTNTTMLKATFDQHYKEWLPQQLQLYKDVNVIVCCGRGVMDCLASIFEQTFGSDYSCTKETYVIEDAKKTIRYNIINKSIYVIDYWHPAARVKTNTKTQELVKIIKYLNIL